jgi:hypothetical protein
MRGITQRYKVLQVKFNLTFAANQTASPKLLDFPYLYCTYILINVCGFAQALFGHRGLIMEEAPNISFHQCQPGEVAGHWWRLEES